MRVFVVNRYTYVYKYNSLTVHAIEIFLLLSSSSFFTFRQSFLYITVNYCLDYFGCNLERDNEKKTISVNYSSKTRILTKIRQTVQVIEWTNTKKTNHKWKKNTNTNHIKILRNSSAQFILLHYIEYISENLIFVSINFSHQSSKLIQNKFVDDVYMAL